MMEVEVWILSGVVSALFVILIILFKASIKRLDDLINEVHDLNNTVSSQNGEIKSNREKNNEQDKRLNNHSDRIRKLEIKQAKL